MSFSPAPLPGYRVSTVRLTVRAALVLFMAFSIGCAAPIGVARLSPHATQRALTANVLSTGELSEKANILLRRANQEEAWREDPAAVIDRIHAALAKPADPYTMETRVGYLDAVAELCFAHAARTGDPRYYRAAAIFAWVYLFPPPSSAAPRALDRGRRLAADLYNRGITLGFSDPESGEVILRAGDYALPFGTLSVEFDEEDLVWGGHRLARFTSVADLEVKGIINRYRASGLGAPLAATVRPLEDASSDGRDAVFSSVRVPVTALLQLESVQADVEGGASHFEGRLSVVAYSEAETVEIDDQVIPLEVEPTAALALQLAESPPWKRELRGFFQGDLAFENEGLLSLAPYRPGRIPLVLVHGTASSSGRWADMVNDLDSDPAIRRHYQILTFSYNTGNPIAYSAWLLRKAIDDLIALVDPEGLDPALDDVVVMGHSQGGLLAKLLVVDSGDSLWKLVADEPPDEIDLEPESREILEGSLLLDPLSHVRRVIFLSTPHHGSRLANLGLAQMLGGLVRSPANLVRATADLFGGDEEAKARAKLERGAGSIGNMSPNSRFVQGLAALPIASGVHAHSIMGVKKEPYETGSDGVVTYQSAHLDDVESELVVHSGHSSQSNPVVVSEVRRILIEHLTEARDRQILPE